MRNISQRSLLKKLCLLALLVTLVSWRHLPLRKFKDTFRHQCLKAQINDEHGGHFHWDKILPSETLHWVECYDKYQCARLEVPLDYTMPHGEKASVALIKFPSKYPMGHEKWRGPILYNPGGPGGSGVDLVLLAGEQFASVIGDDFDHIGFDPRGVGRTTPVLDILPSQAERKIVELQVPPPINSSSDALAKLYASAHILGILGEERGKKVAQHMSTAVVARDMLQITKAHGRDKLLYWGFSYGTVLGNTYAAMFPDNIGRLVVDGVVDADNYYEAAWSNNLIDTDKGYDMAMESCASSSKCSLQEKTPELVKKRLDSIFENLKTNPVAVKNGDIYGIADWAMARQAAFLSLYSPPKMFPRFFQAMADIEKGDGGTLFAMLGKRDSLYRCDCSYDPGVLFPPKGETIFAIACGEGNILNQDLEGLRIHYARMAELSSFADVWSIHGYCNGWNVRASEIFNGPFVGNTSFPLLLIGNVADPVTPLWAAKKMAQGFKDAVVLTQNSSGHCSLAAASLCTAHHIRSYFRDGTLPPKGTVCNVDEHMFPTDDNSDYIKSLSQEDGDLLQAMKRLSDTVDVPRLGLPHRF